MNIDLSKYSHFVDAVTSPTSKDLELWVVELRRIAEAGINPSLLNTGSIGMVGESGEFSEIVKKINWHQKPITPELLSHMKKELGDVIFYWMMCCQALGLDPNDVIGANVDKLKNRYPEGEFSAYRAENRSVDDV
jgi:NTP pyrophosphatase (non-canonical NTP hydrolase)